MSSPNQTILLLCCWRGYFVQIGGIWSVQSTQKRGLLNQDILPEPVLCFDRDFILHGLGYLQDSCFSLAVTGRRGVCPWLALVHGWINISLFKRPRLCVDCTLQTPANLYIITFSRTQQQNCLVWRILVSGLYNSRYEISRYSLLVCGIYIIFLWKCTQHQIYFIGFLSNNI